MSILWLKALWNWAEVIAAKTGFSKFGSAVILWGSLAIIGMVSETLLVLVVLGVPLSRWLWVKLQERRAVNSGRLFRRAMTSHLIICNSCGTRNLSIRSVCLRCGISLVIPIPIEHDSNHPNANKVNAQIPADNKTSLRWNFIRAVQCLAISSVILVGVSIFYYLVIFAPKQEQAKIELKKQQLEEQRRDAAIKTKLEVAKLAFEMVKEQKKEDNQITNEVLLEDCLTTAYKTYEKNWAIAAAKVALKPSSEIRIAAINCIVSTGLNNELCRSLAQYSENARQTAAANYSPSAPLPLSIANDLNADLFRDKDHCLKMYPRH